jgi:hypothetical protein
MLNVATVGGGIIAARRTQPHHPMTRPQGAAGVEDEPGARAGVAGAGPQCAERPALRPRLGAVRGRSTCITPDTLERQHGKQSGFTVVVRGTGWNNGPTFSAYQLARFLISDHTGQPPYAHGHMTMRLSVQRDDRLVLLHDVSPCLRVEIPMSDTEQTCE